MVDNTPMSKKNLKVDANNDQRRLDNFLTYKFPNLPKSKIYSMIRKGEIRINSKRCKAQTKISLGDEIRLPPYLESEKRDNNCLLYTSPSPRDRH